MPDHGSQTNQISLKLLSLSGRTPHWLVGWIVQLCVCSSCSLLIGSSSPSPENTPISMVMKWMHSWPQREFLGEISLPPSTTSSFPSLPLTCLTTHCRAGERVIGQKRYKHTCIYTYYKKTHTHIHIPYACTHKYTQFMHAKSKH